MALNKAKRKELVEEIAKQQHLDMAYAKLAHIENKNKYRNLQRFIHVCRKEREEEDKMLEGELETAQKDAHVREEEALAQEIDKLKHKEMKELRLRQQLRENEPELRELETKLRVAYVTKELTAQIAEREARRIEEKIKEKRENDLLIEARIKEEDLRKSQLEQDMIHKRIYRQELQDQMILKEKSKRFMYEEFLREKKMLDDIVQRIYEEEMREEEIKMCKMQKTKEEMIAFKAAQDVWRQKKRQELDEENIRIQKHLQDRAREIQERQAIKKKASEAKEKVIENIAKKMYESEKEKREREEILQELLEEEQKEAIEQRHRNEVERDLRQRLEMRTSLSRQMVERQERLKQEAKQDAEYKEQMLAQIAEDQRLEQLTTDAKRRKMLQLRHDVEEMMKDKRERRAQEMMLLNKLHEQELKEAEIRQKIIEEERIRLLKDHAQNLLGYLPKGVIKTTDFEHLGRDVMEEYLSHYGNSLFNLS